MTFFRVFAALSFVALLACERPPPPSMRDQVAAQEAAAQEAAKEAEVKKADPAKPAPEPATEPEPEPEPAPEPEPEPELEVPEAAMKEAQAMFDTTCASCHGANGKGDGPVGAALNPHPRDYTDAEWQKSVTNEYLSQVILKGGAAMGKSALMPPNPQLADKPDVLNGLVKIVRSFKGE